MVLTRLVLKCSESIPERKVEIELNDYPDKLELWFYRNSRMVGEILYFSLNDTETVQWVVAMVAGYLNGEESDCLELLKMFKEQ